MDPSYNGSEQLLALLFRTLERGVSDVVGGMLLPGANVVASGQRELTRFLAHPYPEGVEAARRHVVGSSAMIDRWAVLYDGQVEIEGRTQNAVVVEGSEQGLEHGFRLVQRYVPGSPEHPTLLIGLPEFLGRVDQLLS